MAFSFCRLEAWAVALLALAGAAPAWCAQDAQGARDRDWEQELAELPVGIQVVHAPVEVPAMSLASNAYEYLWVYRSQVRSLDGPVRIVEFGSLADLRGEWALLNFTRRPYEASDFEAWYGCPDALLLPGEVYTDPYNWSGHQELLGGRRRWFFIGVDADGRRVKGEASVSLLPSLEPSYRRRRLHAAERTRGQAPAPGSQALPPVPPDAELVTYRSSGRELQAVCIAPPDAEGGTPPGLVYFHDGFELTREDFERCRVFVEAGFVVLLPTLRGENGNEGVFELLLGEVDDARDAVAWLRRSRRVDRDRVYAFGSGVGGAVCALLALDANARLACGASWNGLLGERGLDRWRELLPFDPDDAEQRAVRRLQGNVRYLRSPHRAYVAESSPAAAVADAILVERGCDRTRFTTERVELDGEPGQVRSMRAFVEWVRRLEAGR